MSTDRVTLYFRSEFGMGVKKIEARDLKVEVKPYAQYAHGIYVTFIPKGARRERRLVQAYKPSLVILEGWGHPDPPSLFGKPRDAGDGVTVQEARYSACDDRWQTDFDEILAEHCVDTGAKLLHDFRGHEPGYR